MLVYDRTCTEENAISVTREHYRKLVMRLIASTLLSLSQEKHMSDLLAWQEAKTPG
jgi:hypothetical protein